MTDHGTALSQPELFALARAAELDAADLEVLTDTLESMELLGEVLQREAPRGARAMEEARNDAERAEVRSHLRSFVCRAALAIARALRREAGDLLTAYVSNDSSAVWSFAPGDLVLADAAGHRWVNVRHVDLPSYAGMVVDIELRPPGTGPTSPEYEVVGLFKVRASPVFYVDANVTIDGRPFPVSHATSASVGYDEAAALPLEWGPTRRVPAVTSAPPAPRSLRVKRKPWER